VFHMIAIRIMGQNQRFSKQVHLLACMRIRVRIRVWVRVLLIKWVYLLNVTRAC
jgi:hypothetical protein